MIAAALAGLWVTGALVSGGPDQPKATVTVDSARKEVVVTAGPFVVPSMPPGMSHEDMEMMDDHNTPVIRFEWPVEGWLRGFRVEVTDAEGRPLDRRLIHHLIGVNFDRRQLVYPAIERLFGIGQETDDAYVPKSIGVPMRPGLRLGMYMAWQNESGKDLEGVRIRLRLAYSPKNLNPRPLDALPIYMDVNLTVGGSNTFDIPVGVSEKPHEFVVPTSGRLLGVGGHLHDYGVAVRLEDAESGKVLAMVKASRTTDGKVTRVSRELFGVAGRGLRLTAGHRYRVIGVYQNPTGGVIAQGAMAHMVGLFVPDDYARWPRLDPADATLQEDLASLEEMGRAQHKHGDHGQH